jgi:hypothetical protein
MRTVTVWPAKDDAERLALLEQLRVKLGPRPATDIDLAVEILSVVGSLEQLPAVAEAVAPILRRLAEPSDLPPDWEQTLCDELVEAARWLERLESAMYRARSALFRRVVRQQNAQVISKELAAAAPPPPPPIINGPPPPRLPSTPRSSTPQSSDEAKAEQQRIAGRVQGLLDLSPTVKNP